jgi:hypothetical protein
MDHSQAPEVVQQPVGIPPTAQDYHYPPPQHVDYKYTHNQAHPHKSRICGLSPGRFWAVVIFLVVILAAALGGGIGGGLAAKSHRKSTGSR